MRVTTSGSSRDACFAVQKLHLGKQIKLLQRVEAPQTKEEGED